MLTVRTPPRGSDPGGNGSWGAPRGKRLHMGVDFAAAPESILVSPVRGKVTKLGYPYADTMKYRYVEVTDKNGDQHRFFYVEPLVLLGEQVKIGDDLGVVQNIAEHYPIPKGMKPHIHYEIKDRSGIYINPEKL